MPTQEITKETFNDTIVRLRALVQTEAERDQERRTRQELQQNITRFLDTVVEISQPLWPGD